MCVYYEKHKTKFLLTVSAITVLVFCPVKKSATDVRVLSNVVNVSGVCRVKLFADCSACMASVSTVNPMESLVTCKFNVRED